MKLVAIAAKDGARWLVKAPQPGWFEPTIDDGDTIAPGRALGVLQVLERRMQLVAPDVHGIATLPTSGGRAVGYGDVLVEVDTHAQTRATHEAETSTSREPAKLEPRGLVFRAPTSGRFYVRPGPDKPPYVAVGIELARGATVCLLEVMKTFNRVTYGGAGLPERARVIELLVADGADVNAGDALIVLEAI